MTDIAHIDAALDRAYGGATSTPMQKVMIVQIPSEANAEKLICTRIGDANAAGWTVTQMMDHNGFLVLLLERFGGVA